MYYDGEGVAYDLDESTEWLRKTAEQGHVKAREILDHLSSIPGSNDI